MKVGTLMVTTQPMQRALIRISRNGGVVMVHHTRNHRAEGMFYQLQNGERISKPVIRMLIEGKLLIAADDGLFPGHTQTLRLAP